MMSFAWWREKFITFNSLISIILMFFASGLKRIHCAFLFMQEIIKLVKYEYNWSIISIKLHTNLIATI